MSERWATFDCYGTLVDWFGGVRATLARLWPEVRKNLGNRRAFWQFLFEQWRRLGLLA